MHSFNASIVVVGRSAFVCMLAPSFLAFGVSLLDSDPLRFKAVAFFAAALNLFIY
jgi:hypothetical protein